MMSFESAMARGYCHCLTRQRIDGSCNTVGCSKYRISRAGCRAVTDTRAVTGTMAVRMQLSPFASRVAYRHRLHNKTTATLAGNLVVMDSSQPSRSVSSTTEVPEMPHLLLTIT